MVKAACMPPGDTVARGRSCLQYIRDLVMEVKRRYNDPMIVVAGSLNQWQNNEPLADFVDIAEVWVGPTRGSRSIDLISIKFDQAVTSKGTAPPLETDPLPGRPTTKKIILWLTRRLSASI